MLALERRNLILEQIESEKKVIVSDLSQKFDVSEETIRRDLLKLEKEGFVTKSYGGAIWNDDLYIDIPFNVRKNQNVDRKQIIANLLSEIIKDNDRIMIDASSTAVFASKHLKKKKNLTVITNSVEIIVKLSDVPEFDLIAAGGHVEGSSLAITGNYTQQFLKSFYVDKAIISSRGLSDSLDITDSKENLVYIKRTMLQAAKMKILLIDNTKFGIQSFMKICPINDIDMIITDVKPDDFWLKKLENEHVEVIYPK